MTLASLADAPTLWRVSLNFPASTKPTLAGTHGMACQWLDSDATHRDQVKSWSVSWPERRAGGFDLEVRTFGCGAANRLLARARAGASVRLGQQFGAVARDPVATVATPWSEFARSTSTSAWDIEFVSPTTFRRGNVFHPLPTPRTILTGLRMSWSALSPLPLDGELGIDDVWVSDIAGRSIVIPAPQRTGAERTSTRLTISGFVGNIRLIAPEPSSTAVGQLLRWAEFTGVGAWTTKGLGTVRVQPA